MALTKVSYSMIQGAPANVLDFGADPTGSTDCSAAFTAALAAADCVFVPSGSTFLLSSNLEIADSGKTIFGEGPTSVIKFSGNNRRIIVNAGNFTFANLLINGDKPDVGWETTNNYDFGLKIGDTVAARINNITVQNVIFKDIGLDGIYIENAGKVLIDEDCQFINCRRWGVAVLGDTYGTSDVKIFAKTFDCNYATGPLGKVYPLGAIDLEPVDTAVNWVVIDGPVCNTGEVRVVPSTPGTVTNSTIKNVTCINASIKCFDVGSDVVFENCNIIGDAEQTFLIDYVGNVLPSQPTIKNISIKNARSQSFQTNGRANWLPKDFVAVNDGSLAHSGGSSNSYVPMNIDGNSINVTQFTAPAGTSYELAELATQADIGTNDNVFIALQIDRTDSSADDVGSTWLRIAGGPVDRRTSLPVGTGQWVFVSVQSDATYNNPTFTFGISTSGSISDDVTIQINRAFVFINPPTMDIPSLTAKSVPATAKYTSWTGATLSAYNRNLVILSANSGQNLDTINGGIDGLAVSITASYFPITVRDKAVGGGNIELIGNTTFVLNPGTSTNAITLIYHSDDSSWYQAS